MTLYFEEQGEGGMVALVHGLFGSSVNWRGIARRLASRYRVYNLDLPNHGRSPHTAAMTYADMCAALHDFNKAAGAAAMDWVGHSMGGKAVMDLALQHPDCVRKLVVIDIAPVRYTHSHAAYLDAMLAIDLEAIASRADAEKRLRDAVPDSATRLFLLQNLVLAKGAYRWRLNLPVIRRHLSEIMAFPDHAGATFRGPTLKNSWTASWNELAAPYCRRWRTPS